MHPSIACRVGVSRKTILENVVLGLTRVVLAIVITASVGCGRGAPPQPTAGGPKQVPADRLRRAPAPRPSPAGVPAEDALPVTADLAPERRAIQVAAGAERVV